jgi:hypothetical protein
VPHQSGERVGLRVDQEGQLLGREAVDDLVDDLADPAKGIDKQLRADNWRLLARALLRERRGRQIDSLVSMERPAPFRR